MQKPIIVECYADNGEHSHYELIAAESGATLWSGDPQHKENDKQRKEGMTQGMAVAINYMLRHETAGATWSAGGLSVRECIESNVDGFDLERLIPRFATEHDAEAIANYYIQTLAADSPQYIDAKEFVTELTALFEGVDSPDGDEVKDLSEQAELMRISYIDLVKEGYE